MTNKLEQKLGEYLKFLDEQVEEHRSKLVADHRESLGRESETDQRAFEGMASTESGKHSAYRSARARLYELFPNLKR